MNENLHLFRIHYRVLGGHTHVRVFAGKGSLSLGHCGDLTFRNEEWEALRKHLDQPGPIEIVPEENPQS